MSNRHIIYILALLFLAPAACFAQYLRINHLDSRTDFSFDLNHLYNYNNYERNRWGGGLFLQTPLRYDKRYGYDFQNSLRATAYLGWGTGDKAWKYGGDLSLLFPHYDFRRITFGYRHDVEQIGGHSFYSYNIFNTIENSSYFSSRYSAVDRLWLAAELDFRGPGVVVATLRHSSESLLFNAQGLLFPKIDAADSRPRSDYDEAIVQLLWGDHWTIDLQAGTVLHHFDGSREPFARLVAQYSNTLKLNNNWGNVRLYAQCGTTLGHDTPISRRFSLGGTGGSYYYFSNTLLTLRPNAAMADSYAHLTAVYTVGRPLWSNALSHPTPFLQLNVLWGALRSYNGLSETGLYILHNGHAINTELQDPDPTVETLMLFAPYYGVFEPALGIDQLVRWGIIDFGVSVAWQMTPKKSLLHSDNFFDKFAVMCVAKLVFDNK